MELSNAILIELKDFLFESEENFMTPAIMAWQKMNPEAKELLKETQKYHTILGFYCCNPIVSEVLKSRFAEEGIQFARILISSENEYDQMKLQAVEFYRNNYNISCYIDETENSPWQKIKNLHRLKF